MSAPTAIRGGTAPLAALTTVFTPPCPTTWLLTTTRVLSQYPAFPTTGPASCDPPSWSANIARAGFNFYSPAICPRGFAVGPSCGITKTRTAEGFPAVAPGETAVYCVPTGLTCTTDTSDFRGGVWGFARDATTSGALVTVGPALQIRWVDADLTMLETHPLTPGLKLARTEEPKVPTTLVPATSSSTTAARPATNAASEQQRQTTSKSSQLSSATLVTDTKTVEVEETISLIFETGDPTTSSGPSSTAASNSQSGGLGSLDRGTSIVVIVVVTVVAGILLWTAAFLLIRRHKRKAERRKRPGSKRTGADGNIADAERTGQRTTAPMTSPASELDANPTPAIGSTPNPAELEGDTVLQLPTKLRAHHQRSWLRSPSMHPPPYSPYSPRSMRSTRSRRTVRESFGEKINDPAAALGRLKIPNPLSIGRPSPGSASPRGGSFWRLPRSPRSPSAAAVSVSARLSAQLPKPSPRSGLSENAPGLDTPSRGAPGLQDGADIKYRDVTPGRRAA